MRSQKSLYILLIALAALISLYFWGQTVRSLMAIRHLEKKVSARIVRWEVDEKSSDQYAIKAHYTIELNGQVFHGKTLFAKPKYLNSVAAIAAIREMAKQSWTAWVDRKNPTRSTLEKVFPTGFLFRASIATIVLAYFVLSGGRRISRALSK